MTADRLTALRRIARATAADIEAFRDAPVGNIVDALGRSGALCPAIKPVTSARCFCGPALPVDAGPRDNLAPWAALKLAVAGDVMMVATGGYLAGSVCGDLMAGMARNADVVAIVTDGAVRDVSGIEALGIPVFAAAVSPNSPQKNGPGSVGPAVVIGGVRVAAGDIVCGDEDGVVVIPAARIAEARAALVTVRDKEKSMEAEVARGETAPLWVRNVEPDDLFTFVD